MIPAMQMFRTSSFYSVIFSEGEMAFEHRLLTIKHEPPFSDWLHDYVSKTLEN